MTVEQFSQIQTPDTEDYELVEGELVPLSSGIFGIIESGTCWCT